MTTPQLKCHPHSQRPFKGTGGLYRASTTAEAASATQSVHTDHASHAAERRLIPPLPLPCSLVLPVTTPLYSTTVSQALRQALRRVLFLSRGKPHLRRLSFQSKR